MPEIRNVSGTAFIIAEFRAEENDAPEPLYTDETVKLFLNKETKEIADRAIQTFPVAKEMVKLRTRYFDDVLSEHINRGYKQVVILGSGLDTRAVRKRAEGVTYFEIDRETTLQLKAECLKANGITANVEYIPADYVKENLIDLLQKHHFDCELPTYFIWEGNITYLQRHQIVAVLDVIRDRVRDFQISLDFLSDQVISRTTGHPELDHYMDELERMEAPWITGFRDIHKFAKGLGFDVIEQASAAELWQRWRPNHSCPPKLFDFYFVCTLMRSL